MQTDEEFFIVRYSGSQSNRNAIFDYLTGQSRNFERYSQFFPEMEVKRVQSLKDFFTAMNPVEGVQKIQQQLKQKCAPKAVHLKNAPPPETSFPKSIEKFEQLLIPKNEEEKPNDLLDLSIPSTSNDAPKKAPKKKIVRIKRRKLHKLGQFEMLETKQESSIIRDPLGMETIPLQDIAPHYSTSRARVFTSQSLKRHNISFEKKKT